MILCAGDSESFDFATPIGVGLVDSAMNTTRICIMNAPKYILFVGSAGSYGGHKLFDILESKTASNIEHSFFEKKSYTPIDNLITSQDSQFESKIIVNSSNYITTDDAISQKMHKVGIGLENMEFFSIMRVAQEFNIACGGIFIVTNYTNANAHNDFLANHEKAKQMLSSHINNLIEKKII